MAYPASASGRGGVAGGGASAASGAGAAPKPAGTTLKMALDKVLGKGVFGTVMEGTIMETGERVAIKRVKQDARFKNRELPIMKSLHHPNIVALKHYFFQDGKEEGELYLNLVMEYMPETLYSVTHSLSKLGQIAPQVNIKLYFYQLCRGLAYLHSTGVCHRDVKPQNVLVNPKTHVVKLCDFGSAKALKASEPSVAYICSRFYRAPELTLGQTIYSVAVDMWAAGCVLGEMMLGHALFRGESGVLQIVEIVKVLGTPTREQLIAMNPEYTEMNFEGVRPTPWDVVFKNRAPLDAIDLIASLLTYEPDRRLSAIEACAHPYFDDLRDPGFRLPDGAPLPPLFNFSGVELAAVPPHLREILIPEHARNPVNWPTSTAGSGAGGIPTGSMRKPTVGSTPAASSGRLPTAAGAAQMTAGGGSMFASAGVTAPMSSKPSSSAKVMPLGSSSSAPTASLVGSGAWTARK